MIAILWNPLRPIQLLSTCCVIPTGEMPNTEPCNLPMVNVYLASSILTTYPIHDMASSRHNGKQKHG